ncbi:Fic family protein [Bacillus subtilis]|uniref:Fic/DOC family protein n=1 Tax=Bacillus subtilis TaxID=1423 RepID=UPI000EF1D694|nr:Fic family protein [Bacillus subtilis]AYK68299.1 cell filamentation protein Fic [Bacillus subtilis subsp. subtilis]MCY7883137.1 Fic family protein [Bacillus spizizenii]MCY8635289.1 Fic family protein [Bacillus spizizenii]MDO3655372.1 Fic family protein [Bacillus subtilis]
MSRYQSRSTYFYPSTNVLKNKFDIMDEQTLEKFERQIVANKLLELTIKPIMGDFNFAHLKKIHRFLFEKVYPFAGEIRSEGISKGNTHFAQPNYIEAYANSVFSEMKSEKHLSKLSFEEFCERASYYMAEINIIHPFREGNGRAQREFFRMLSMKNGFNMEWDLIDKKDMLNASIRSVLDEKAFVPIFKEIITNEEPDQSLIKDYKRMSRKNDDLEL